MGNLAMKNLPFLNFKHYTVLFFWILSLSGCIFSEESELILSPIRTTPITINTIQPTPSIATTLANSGTVTIFLSPTPTITLTPTQTLLPPTVTPTITPLPTLSVQEEGELLQELMANNGDCELPCWWGVMPGHTPTQLARDIFASQGIDDWVISNGTYLMSLGYPHGDSPYYSGDVSMRFGTINGLIQFIDISGSRRPGDDGYLFMRDWQRYSLAQMLDIYGIPSYVALTNEVSADTGPDYYNLGVAFVEYGVEIHYITIPVLINGQENICDEFQYVNFIRLILYPPEKVSDISVDIISNNLNVYTFWEEVTGYDLENFYERFRDVSNSDCIEIP